MSSEFLSNHGFTAEIAETAEEPRGVEITGCLPGEGAIYCMKAVLEIGKKAS